MARTLTAEEREELRQAIAGTIEKPVVLKFEAEGLDEVEERVERLLERLVVVEATASRALGRMRELSQFLEEGITGGLERLQEFQDMLEAMGAEKVDNGQRNGQTDKGPRDTEPIDTPPESGEESSGPSIEADVPP